MLFNIGVTVCRRRKLNGASETIHRRRITVLKVEKKIIAFFATLMIVGEAMSLDFAKSIPVSIAPAIR